jgi:hypothetical protein
MISKGQYQQAEKQLRNIAKINRRKFNEEDFQTMIKEQQKVISSYLSSANIPS